MTNQLQALKALEGLTRRSSADGSGSLAAVQRAFRDGSGFSKLMALLDRGQSGFDHSSHVAASRQAERQAAEKAVSALLALTRNSAKSRCERASCA